MRWLMSSLIIFIILLVTAHSYAGLSGSLDEQKIIERIKPEGEVKVEGGTLGVEKAPAITDVGQSVYEKICKTCHETGLADAPKLGNKGDWAPRVAQGMDTLMKHAINGLKAMPPKGGCSTCSDEDIKKAVNYMLDHSK